MVLRKFALARSIELQFVDGATKTTGLAVLRTCCTKTQSAAFPRLGLAYVHGKLVTGAPWHAREPMADISEFSIVTYERKPGCWRAAVIRKRSIKVGGDKVHSIVTPEDYPSEADAWGAAQKLIRKL
jgi:hypothetical protein